MTWTQRFPWQLPPEDTRLCLSFPHGYAVNEPGNIATEKPSPLCLMENSQSHQRGPWGKGRDMPDYFCVRFSVAASVSEYYEKENCWVRGKQSGIKASLENAH